MNGPVGTDDGGDVERSADPAATLSPKLDGRAIGWVGLLVAAAVAVLLLGVTVLTDAKNAGKLQAAAAAVSLAVTGLLILVTGMYVSLTKEVADATAKASSAATDAVLAGQRQAAAAEEAIRVAQAEASEAAWLRRTEQARNVGAYLGLSAEYHRGIKDVTFYLLNTSKLPIRDVRGYLVTAADAVLVKAFDPIDVFHPAEVADSKSDRIGTQRVTVDVSTIDAGLHLIVEFDDDSGTRWRKYNHVGGPALALASEFEPLGI